jgi:hypothetical protein
MWQITPATTIHWVMSNLVTNLDRRILHNENLSIDKQIMEMMETNGVKSKEISTNTFASLLPIPDFGADGVVTNISSDHRSADVCLAGLPIDILTISTNFCYRLPDIAGGFGGGAGEVQDSKDAAKKGPGFKG